MSHSCCMALYRRGDNRQVAVYKPRGQGRAARDVFDLPVSPASLQVLQDHYEVFRPLISFKLQIAFSGSAACQSAEASPYVLLPQQYLRHVKDIIPAIAATPAHSGRHSSLPELQGRHEPVKVWHGLHGSDSFHTVMSKATRRKVNCHLVSAAAHLAL